MMARARKPKPQLTFICDTREKPGSVYWFKRPVRREFGALSVAREKLDEADYAVRLGDVLLPVRCERKAIGDLFMCAGWDRDRFERELARLMQYERRYLIIEATWQQVYAGYERSQVSGKKVLASVASWQDEFGIAAQFVGTWANGRAFTQRLLEEAAARYLTAQRAAEGKPVPEHETPTDT